MQQAVKRQPNLADVHYLLGVTNLVQNDLLAAKSELEEAVLLKPDGSQSHYYLGYTYARLGQRAKALSHLSEAVKLDPQRSEYQNALNIVNNGQSLP